LATFWMSDRMAGVHRLLLRTADRIPPVARLRAERDRLSAEVVELRDQLARTEADCEAARLDGRQRAEQAERAEAEVAALRQEVAKLRPAEPAYRLFPEGHFHSPIPNLPDVRQRADQLFDRTGNVFGVELRHGEQLALLDELGPALARWPYGDPGARDGLRYQPNNEFFGWTDAQFWYALLATRRPRRVVEVGSGWSTALLVDACEREALDTTVTAIEPFPDRLHSVLRDGDADRVTVLRRRVQDVPVDEIADLQAGDVLFIDSTHVAKIGSDVNHLVFGVFPRLPAGVLVHVHDIAYPFEYPQEWVEEGRAWNEAYVLRGFLLQNPRWRVRLWSSFLWLREPDRMRRALHPDTLVDGASLWLETT
jgi:predicted O-methyltransferase YrrM